MFLAAASKQSFFASGAYMGPLPADKRFSSSDAASKGSLHMDLTGEDKKVLKNSVEELTNATPSCAKNQRGAKGFAGSEELFAAVVAGDTAKVKKLVASNQLLKQATDAES